MAKKKTPTTVLVLKFDGNEYEYAPDLVTARIVRRVREATGITPNTARLLLSEDADVDVMLVLYYTAALQAGKDPNFEALLDEVSMTNPIEAELREAEEDPET